MANQREEADAPFRRPGFNGGLPDEQELKEWLRDRLPGSVTASDPKITADEDEILIVLNLNTSGLPDGEGRAEAERNLIDRRRGETRALRVQIGRRLGRVFGRAVSWGMRAGNSEEMFTNNTAPVMTRLSRDERRVLDALVTANVARTRSSALSYIVRAFATEHADWLHEVQEAMSRVSGLREKLDLQQRQGPPPTDTVSSE